MGAPAAPEDWDDSHYLLETNEPFNVFAPSAPSSSRPSGEAARESTAQSETPPAQELIGLKGEVWVWRPKWLLRLGVASTFQYILGVLKRAEAAGAALCVDLDPRSTCYDSFTKPGTDANWFEDISETFDLKMKALEAYNSEMREWPHARSIKAVEHLCKWRGSIVGCEAAEAFYLVRCISK